MSATQVCPICSTAVEPVPRYPKYLCSTCAAQAKSRDGRSVVFSNADATGGFVAHFADEGSPYSSHECFVSGIKCYADEARFGGIVIQRTDEPAGHWEAVRRLVGTDLTTLNQKRSFTVDEVNEKHLLVSPSVGSGKKRTILRERVEFIANLGIPRDEIRKRVLREYPASRNASYIAAILHQISLSQKI
ncbi:hypothetical protein NA78x_001060 [Anatilimnocola sp. NA78]|uniref:hypothetical protein n=1 Tax=Anatilimnocola sp. NA78 TaxID=3415683 RepID=UPI003CE47300